MIVDVVEKLLFCELCGPDSCILLDNPHALTVLHFSRNIHMAIVVIIILLLGTALFNTRHYI